MRVWFFAEIQEIKQVLDLFSLMIYIKEYVAEKKFLIKKLNMQDNTESMSKIIGIMWN